MKVTKYLSAVMFGILAVSTVQAAEIEVQMLNRGEKGMMVFEPNLVVAQKGDTVRFIPTDKGHNVQSIKNMLPEGVSKFKSAFNEEFVLQLDEDGFYGVKCSPHYPMGMVALIKVGDPNNGEKAQGAKNPPKARKLFKQLFDQANKAQ